MYVNTFFSSSEVIRLMSGLISSSPWGRMPSCLCGGTTGAAAAVGSGALVQAPTRQAHARPTAIHLCFMLDPSSERLAQVQTNLARRLCEHAVLDVWHVRVGFEHPDRIEHV